jgi:nucleoside-diphosphate-sugar epimerase
MERIVHTAGDMGVTWAIVRPTSLWGPWFDVPYKNFFTAIARNIYVHPAGVKTLKQWGFVGNSVYQVARLLEAPAEKVHKKTFYLADYEPVELYEFATLVQRALGARPIKVVPPGVLKGIAFIGDFLQKLGWRNIPLTSFRYGNIVTSEIQDVEPLRNVVKQLPYTVDKGVEITAKWMQSGS